MSIFPKASPASAPKSKQSRQVAVLYAVILVVLAVTQLFSFEEFIGLVPSFNLPLGDNLQSLIVPLIVVSEVFALPFLLRMPLSPAFRWFSMFLGWLVAVLWFFISIWIVNASAPVESIGFFGTIIPTIPGWWAVLLSLAMGILAAWASWGLWPARNTKKQL